jgi:thiamine pyrophosphate-dependent acetolactate synthase large subunit-like protein
MTDCTGGEALTSSLSRHGVDLVWGIPGTHNLEIYASLSGAGIRMAPCRHEQGAAFAADGFARATGRVGVCVTTSGPGVLNAATALAQSWSDSIPVLLVSAGLPLRHPGRGNGYLHETKDLRGALEGIVAYSHRVTSVEEIPTAVAQAFATMTSGRPRPIHLEVPHDILTERAAVEPVAPVATAVPTPPAPAALQAAAARLATSERPAIIAGGGALGCADALQAVARRLAAPVVTTFNGHGAVPSTDSLCAGTAVHLRAVRRMVEECDAVLVVGSELAPADHWDGPLPLAGRLLRIDIDPAELVTNGTPDVALVADATVALEALLEAWNQNRLPPAPPERSQRAHQWRARMCEEAERDSARWDWLLDAIAAATGVDGVVACDSAMVCYRGAAVRLPAHRPRSFLYPTGYGTLGYGLPAGIGAKLGRGDDPVVVLIGDGGLMFTVAEFAAAAQLGIALPVVVVDNGGYGEIRAEMRERGDTPLGVDLPSPDFPLLARSLGCQGQSVEDADALSSALDRALAADRPTLLHIRDRG